MGRMLSAIWVLILLGCTTFATSLQNSSDTSERLLACREKNGSVLNQITEDYQRPVPTPDPRPNPTPHPNPTPRPKPRTPHD